MIRSPARQTGPVPAGHPPHLPGRRVLRLPAVICSPSWPTSSAPFGAFSRKDTPRRNTPAGIFRDVRAVQHQPAHGDHRHRSSAPGAENALVNQSPLPVHFGLFPGAGRLLRLQNGHVHWRLRTDTAPGPHLCVHGLRCRRPCVRGHLDSGAPVPLHANCRAGRAGSGLLHRLDGRGHPGRPVQCGRLPIRPAHHRGCGPPGRPV